jgi:hypothetical protein
VMAQAAQPSDLLLADFNSWSLKLSVLILLGRVALQKEPLKESPISSVSPETMEDLRAISYNPVNTTAGVNTGGTASGVVAAPESFRDKVFANGGVPELYGIGLMEMNELGRARKFCKLMDAFMNASPVTGNAGLFDIEDDLVIGIDRSRESLIRAVATDSETGSEFSLIADDQYSNRQQKLGWFGSVEEGRMVVDNRVLTGVVVANH